MNVMGSGASCLVLVPLQGQVHQRLRMAYGCLDEAFTVGILVYALQQRSHSAREFLLSYSKLFGRRMKLRDSVDFASRGTAQLSSAKHTMDH